MKKQLVVALLLTVCVCSPAMAQPGALKAVGVRDWIRLEVRPTDTSTPAKPEFEVVYLVDGETRNAGPLDKDQQFAAKSTRGITITLSNFNPLTQAVTVSVEDAPDPSHEIVAKLVESLMAVSTAVGANVTPTTRSEFLPKEFETCKDAYEDATGAVDDLVSALNDKRWSASTIKRAIDDASKAINGGFNKGGALAVADGVTVLDAFLGADQEDAKTSLLTLRGALRTATAAVKRINDHVAVENPEGCDAQVHYIYALASVSNLSERVAALTKIVKGFSDIVEYLRPYSEPSRWSSLYRSEFKVRSGLNPTSSALKKVKIAVVSRNYEQSSTPGLMTVKTSDLASGEFIVRRYSAWVPEIGVGITFNKVDRPIYGTGKNAAGQTTIALSASDTSTKVDPTLMVNFVCGFCGLTPLTPMFQIGTSTSKTTPAILLGGGIRFATTAKGDFGIGYGAILPWAKQLKNESDLGKVIDGTAALEEHLEWRRVAGFHSYVTLQYKF